MRDRSLRRSGVLILLEGGRIEPLHSGAAIVRKIRRIEEMSKQLVDELEEILKEFED